MEVSGHSDVSAAFFFGNEPLVPITWTTKPVCLCWRIKHSLLLRENLTLVVQCVSSHFTAALLSLRFPELARYYKKILLMCMLLRHCNIRGLEL